MHARGPDFAQGRGSGKRSNAFCVRSHFVDHEHLAKEQSVSQNGENEACE